MTYKCSRDLELKMVTQKEAIETLKPGILTQNGVAKILNLKMRFLGPITHT